MPKRTYLQAIADAQRDEMRRDPRVFIMGEDIRSDIFGASKDYVTEFGKDRIIDTPISEAGMTGIVAGAAMTGMRPILDYTCSVFMYPAMDQIMSIIAKSRYLYGGQASLPLVLRSVMFYKGGMAAQHSDRPYSMFMGMPGLKIVVPSNPYDMKGLLKAAIRDDDPVLCFEDVTLWSARAEIPEDDYIVPIGEGIIRRKGSDVTIVAIGATNDLALAAADDLSGLGVSAEVIDPRSLAPLDYPLILDSVSRTGSLVITDIAFETCSAASQIAAVVVDQAFSALRGPIRRVTTKQTHIPFSPPLEQPLYPTKEQIVEAAFAAMGRKTSRGDIH